MSAGAFALYIDQAAGGAPNALIRRVIPLPPTSGGDAINFNQGRLSLAYDDFGAGTGPILTPILALMPVTAMQGDLAVDDTSVGLGSTNEGEDQYQNRRIRQLRGWQI